MVRYEERGKFIAVINQMGFKSIPHPHRYNIFLYGVNKFEFFKNNKQIIIDLNFQISVRSLDKGQWIPLDQEIQESAWSNKFFEKLEGDFNCWVLSREDEFVCLISRSIFDKREFQTGYIERLNFLVKTIDRDSVIEKFNLVFFKFTPFLMKYIENKEYENIVKQHLQFKEY